ncbi:hypothetical protein ACLOJK_034785 [Asimina triloba]
MGVDRRQSGQTRRRRRVCRRPDLAADGDNVLRRHRNWTKLDVARKIDASDYPTGHSLSVGFADDVAAFVFSGVGGFAGDVDGNSYCLWLCLAFVGIVRGPIHRSDPTLEVTGCRLQC